MVLKNWTDKQSLQLFPDLETDAAFRMVSGPSHYWPTRNSNPDVLGGVMGEEKPTREFLLDSVWSFLSTFLQSQVDGKKVTLSFSFFHCVRYKKKIGFKMVQFRIGIR
jgi:hypothetical protein